MLVIRGDQLKKLSEARKGEAIGEVLARAADVIGSPPTAAHETWRRLATLAFEQADGFLFLDRETRLRFAEHCLRRGALFEPLLQNHLMAAEVAQPGWDDLRRFTALVELQRNGRGAEPLRRPPRDPASQPLRLDDL
jgi:hypothetical protein